jgi:hypothetical protein
MVPQGKMLMKKVTAKTSLCKIFMLLRYHFFSKQVVTMEDR